MAAVTGAEPIASPWSQGELARVVWNDVNGSRAPGITRSDAMKVPSIVRGRALIAGLLAKSPLAVFDGDTPDPNPPAWLTRTDGTQSPQARTLWTYDDLIFTGFSLHTLTYSGSDVATCTRKRRDLWRINPTTYRIETTDIPGGTWKAESKELVRLIEGPQEGLLTLAPELIRAARDMETAWAQRVATPVPLVELRATSNDYPLTPSEAEELVAQWETKRRTGGTAYVPYGLEMHEHGQAATDLFVQGRNALRLDVANVLSLPSALLEGSMSTASLTYSTRDGQRNDLADLSLSYWANPYEARLSLDDMVPAGKSVRFDLSAMASPVQPATNPTTKD